MPVPGGTTQILNERCAHLRNHSALVLLYSSSTFFLNEALLPAEFTITE
jgi:hypothetical protein